MQSDKLKRKQPSHSSEDKDLQTPQKKINTKFNEAKQMFRRTLTPTKLIGRNSERNTIQIFLNMTYKSKKNGSLYISGCPGTGKTALVKEILEKYDYLYINCMSTKSSDIFKAIKLKVGTKLELSDYFKNTSFLLVLDEIDSLLEKDNVVLYSLFEWASKGKLVLVGIANQLDLTSRFLPRLKAKNCEPQYLSFEPYKVPEITAIITDRLVSLDIPTGDTPCKRPKCDSPLKLKHKNQNPTEKEPLDLLMHPKAIELCARKLASTGDLRKALDVCRYLKLTSQAIQLLETEHTKNPTTPTKVTIKHILTATKSMLTSPIQQRLLELGTHQKLILLALCFMKSLKLKSDLKNLEVCYRTLCMFDKCVVNLGSSDFMDVVGMLEVQAFLHRGKKGVDLNVNPDDVLKALERCKVLEEVVRDQGKVLIK